MLFIIGLNARIMYQANTNLQYTGNPVIFSKTSLVTTQISSSWRHHHDQEEFERPSFHDENQLILEFHFFIFHATGSIYIHIIYIFVVSIFFLIINEQNWDLQKVIKYAFNIDWFSKPWFVSILSTFLLRSPWNCKHIWKFKTIVQI